jgi:hypothetical protein
VKAGTKKVSLVLGLLLGVFLATSLYYGFKLTRNIDPQWVQDPNPVEAYEANRKIRLLSNSEARSKGFVRLSEVEINSYLQEKVRSLTNSPASLALVQAAVRLAETNVTFICWTHKNLLGFQVPFVYQRSYKFGETNAISDLELESIKVGTVEIPKALWTRAESFFSSTDTRFEDRRRWIAELPAVLLTRNELTHNPEVRLYNFQPRDL